MKCRSKKIQWSQEEDILLRSLVRRYGQKKWAKMSEQINRLNNGKEKSGKQCRQRWYNHLDISITKKQWSHQEEDLLFSLHERYGNKWTTIAEQMNGRSDNSVKNHFYSVLRKSLRRINKYLGLKDSTAKIQKIKSSTLTKIFQFKQQVQEVKLGQRNQQPQYLNEQKNCKQYAYLLIKFSRSKLLNKKTTLNRKDKEIFQKILQTVIKINDYSEKQQKTLNKLRTDEEKSENSQNSLLVDQKLLKNNKKFRQTNLLQQKPTPNNPNCQSQPSHKDSLNQYNNLQNEYSFYISLSEHDDPQMENKKFQLFLPVTPYLLTPQQEQNKNWHSGLQNIINKDKNETIISGGKKIFQWGELGERQQLDFMDDQQDMQ